MSFTLNLYEVKGEALQCDNCHSLKLTNQVMKLSDWVLRLLHSQDGKHWLDAIKYRAWKRYYRYNLYCWPAADISPPPNCSTLLLSSLWKPFIVCIGSFCGGLGGEMGCMSHRIYAPMPGITCGLIVSMARSLAWKCVGFMALSLAYCSSSWFF